MSPAQGGLLEGHQHMFRAGLPHPPLPGLWFQVLFKDLHLAGSGHKGVGSASQTAGKGCRDGAAACGSSQDVSGCGSGAERIR